MRNDFWALPVYKLLTHLRCKITRMFLISYTCLADRVETMVKEAAANPDSLWYSKMNMKICDKILLPRMTVRRA